MDAWKFLSEVFDDLEVVLMRLPLFLLLKDIVIVGPNATSKVLVQFLEVQDLIALKVV